MPISSRSTKKVQISVDGTPLSGKAFSENKRKYLPNYVFGYYSGPSNRMQEHFLKHQDQFYTALIKKTYKKTLPCVPSFLPSTSTANSFYSHFSLNRIKEALRFLD